jgi:hypothetical protein
MDQRVDAAHKFLVGPQEGVARLRILRGPPGQGVGFDVEVQTHQGTSAQAGMAKASIRASARVWCSGRAKACSCRIMAWTASPAAAHESSNSTILRS